MRLEGMDPGSGAPGASAAPQGLSPLERPPLFAGPFSLRVRGERQSMWTCLLLAPITIGLIGLIFKSVTVADMTLLVIAGMVFVSISRGRLLGSSVRIHERQLPELHRIVDEVARRLGIEQPQIFVRDDPFVPIAAVGIGSPYALILSSQYLEHLHHGELRFLVARELAHIAAGHTRGTSLLSVSGRENAAVAFVFGAWLRKTEYTADRVGLLCAESLADAIGAISITTFHAIGRRIDMQQLAEQKREIEAEPTLRMGQWGSGMPYAVNRIAELATFANSDLARYWQRELDRPVQRVADVEAPVPLGQRVHRRDCAPVWRRALAFGVDFTLISIIVNSLFPPEIHTTNVTAASKALAGTDVPFLAKFLSEHHVIFTTGAQGSTAVLVFCLYAAVLVAVSGQTLGMMVAELRVVTTGFATVGIARTIWRYMVATMCLVAFPLAMLGIVFRIHVHDRLSGTRVVRSRTKVINAHAGA
jgi:Zn-dependent protease with chaperone function/uncharacterized RDD family membrane protein YckC